ncbi:MAG: CCC motif membrane protein [Bacteroidales bacterium]
MAEINQPSEETNENKEVVVREQVPNATAVLVLGILSLLFWCCWGIGLILGIIGLILGVKSKKIYNESPDRYSVSSYKNLNAGYICSLIGTILAGLYLLLIIIGLLIGTSFMNFFPWENILNNINF